MLAKKLDKMKLAARNDPEQPDEPTEVTPLRPTTTTPCSSKACLEEPVALTQNPVLWIQSLSNSYSWQLLAMIVCTTHLLKGFVAGGGDEGLVGKPIEFMFADLGITAGRLQVWKAAAISPWALKPVIAILSDVLPICGYKKMPYVVLTTIMALFGAMIMGLGLAKSAPWIVASLFLIFLQVSTVDLLLQAKQSEEVKQKAHLGPQFFTFTWLGINAGQVAGVCVLGPLIHHFGPRIPYLLAVPFIGLVLWPTLKNFMGEKRLPLEDRGINFTLIAQHPLLCSMTLMIGCLIVSLITCTFILSDLHITILAVLFACVVLVSFLIFFRWEIAGPIVFYFLLGMMSFNIDGALFYFYTDSYQEFPEGPHFTAYFYTSGMGIATFVGIMIGFVTGAQLFKNWDYRSILKFTIILRAFTQLTLVPVLLRWTARPGLEAGWIIVNVLIDTVVFAWRWIPKQVMSAHLTPKGVEATMLGLNAGTFNMAMILSSYCGNFLMYGFGVKPGGQVGESHMFANLWKAQVVAALAPCLLLFILPVFIPAKMQTEPLITERHDSATYNSAYEAAFRLTTARSRRRVPQ